MIGCWRTPLAIVRAGSITPEMMELLKQPGHITVCNTSDVQWLPRPAETCEPEPHIWRMLSLRSKLRDWADWMPIQEALHG